MQRNGHRETWALGQQGFRLWLAKRYYDAHAKPQGKRRLNRPSRVSVPGHSMTARLPVFVRLGEDQVGALYLDLGDTDWTVVKGGLGRLERGGGVDGSIPTPEWHGRASQAGAGREPSSCCDPLINLPRRRPVDALPGLVGGDRCGPVGPMPS